MNQLKYCQQLFVSPQWLFGNITNPDNNTQDDSCIVVVDCRFSLTDPLLGRNQYQMGHIPGAYYLDLNQDLSGVVGQHGGRHPLPDVSILADKLAQMGINHGESLVVAYDDSRLAFASRLWWLLRYLGHENVAVLDGGFSGWQSLGYPVSNIPSTIPGTRGNFTPHPQVTKIVDFNYVKHYVEQINQSTLIENKPVLIDSREGDRYRGEREPIDPIAGRIPGAINYPWQGVTNGQGYLVSEQGERWQAIANSPEIIVYCGSGVTACVNLLSLEIAGISTAKLYPGSWSDWISYQTNNMFSFIRSDLSEFTSYKPHPSSDTLEPVKTELDRLDTNESPYDLPQEIKKKLAETFQHTIESNRYPDGGHEALKAEIAQYVSESAGLSSDSFSAVNISVGNGSDELIRSLLISTCLGGAGSILVANPTFSMYAILAQTLGISVVSVGRNHDHFEMDLAAAQTALKGANPPVRAVFVVHPNSPTANCLTISELNWLQGLPPDILVVIDEAYFEFSQNTLVEKLIKHPNWVILRTFSKAFRLAAMRVGYCVGHPQVISILEKVRLPYNLPSFSLAGALVALQNRQLLLSSIVETLTERDKLIQDLSTHPILEVVPSSTNFIYVRLKHNDSPDGVLKTISQKLRSQGTLIRLLPGGLRITIGTPEENARTLKRLRQI